MRKVKDDVTSLLERLPDDCTFEDVQYHLYVFEKIHRGIERAKEEGTPLNKKSKGNSTNGLRSEMVPEGYYGKRLLLNIKDIIGSDAE